MGWVAEVGSARKGMKAGHEELRLRPECYTHLKPSQSKRQPLTLIATQQPLPV